MTLYFDNSATTWPKPDCVVDAIQEWFRDFGVDPSRGSSARHEEVARRVARLRRLLAELGATKPERVILTSGATEALNLYIKGSLQAGDRVWTTKLEHNAIARPLVAMRDRLALELRVFDLDGDRVSCAQVEAALREDGAPALFAYSHASNVTGAVQDFSPITTELRNLGCRVLVDCSQSAGRLRLDSIAADALAIPGHKGLYGPPGVGALVLRPDTVTPRPLLEGGTGSTHSSDTMPESLPSALECGTPNTPGHFGWLAGIEWVLERGFDELLRHELALLDRILAGLSDLETLRVVHANEPRVAVASLYVDGLDAHEAAMALEADDAVIRAGYHCAPYVHDAIDHPEGSLRVSPGALQTEADADALVAALRELC